MDERQKAEIEKLKAETNKLNAEARKLNAEADDLEQMASIRAEKMVMEVESINFILWVKWITTSIALLSGLMAAAKIIKEFF